MTDGIADGRKVGLPGRVLLVWNGFLVKVGRFFRYEFDVAVRLVDAALVLLAFFWVYAVAYFGLTIYGRLPYSPTVYVTLNELFGGILLFALFVVIVSIGLGWIFRHYSSIPLVGFTRLSSLARWTYPSLLAILVFLLVPVVNYLSQTAVISSSLYFLFSDLLVGLLVIFLSWMSLFGVAYFVMPMGVESTDSQYFSVLGAVATDGAMREARRTRFVLKGCYKALARRLRKDVPGIEWEGLASFFTKLQVSVLLGREDQWEVVSGFSLNMSEVLDKPKAEAGELARIMRSIDMTTSRLDGVVETRTVASLEISWPGRLGSFAGLSRSRVVYVPSLIGLISAIITFLARFALK